MKIDYSYTYTISIAHFNSPHLLMRMLKSIPERDDIQIVVVDDFSSRECREQLANLQHKNLEIYYQPSNQGTANARNKASKHAKGKWLLAVDCDDMFVDGAFDILDKYKNEKVDFVSYCISCRDPKTLEPNGKFEKADLSVRKYLEDKSEKNLKLFKYMNTDTWNKMVSMDFFKKNNIHWETNCRVNVDVLYSFLIAKYAKSFIAIPNELYWFVGDTNSITRKKRSIEREFQFFLAAQKRNGFFKLMGMGYPYYRSTWLYVPYLIKKRGFIGMYRFFKYCFLHRELIKEARNKFKYLAI